MCQALFDIYKDDLMEKAMEKARKEIAKETETKVVEKQKKNILNLMNNANFTLEQALDVLMISEEERKLYNFI